MTEIVKVEDNELLSEEDLMMVRRYDEISKRYKAWRDSKQKEFEAFLDAKGIDSYTQGGTTIYRTQGYTKKQVDTKKMKEEGVYDLYTRDVYVSGSIKVKVEYD
jgi:hypothetical protein